MTAYLQGTFEERCSTTGAPIQLSYFTAIILLVLLCFNIPGNILLITAVAVDPFKNLRTPFNYLMANLAVADLITGIIVEPVSFNFLLKEILNKELSDAEIRVTHISYFISCTASVLSLASLAVERYLALCNPLTYRNKITRKRILTTVSAIWFISLTLPFVYFEVGFITCAFILVNTSAVVSIAVTCFTYAVMVYKFRQRRNTYKATTQEIETPGMMTLRDNPSVPKQPTRTNTLRDNAVLLERKVTKMFLFVMVGLLCCYGPAFIFIYVTSFCTTCSCATLHWFRDLHMVFTMINANVNFFSYSLRSQRFRKTYGYILRIWQRNQEIPTRSTTGETSVQTNSQIRGQN